jgi:hypothetical protein
MQKELWPPSSGYSYPCPEEIIVPTSSAFSLKKMFRGTLSLTQENHHFKFLLSPVRFTKCLGVRVTLHPPRKKALPTSNMV